jgi:primosomal protein N''
MSNRFYHKSLLSQIAFITKSLLSQNRFYHRIALIATLLQPPHPIYSKARPGTTVRPPRAPMTYWTTTDNPLDAIGSIETKCRTVHHVKSLLSQIAFITKSLLSQIAFITDSLLSQIEGETRDNGPTSQSPCDLLDNHRQHPRPVEPFGSFPGRDR